MPAGFQEMISNQLEWGRGDGYLAGKLMWTCQGTRCQRTRANEIPEGEFRGRQEKRVQIEPREIPIVRSPNVNIQGGVHKGME